MSASRIALALALVASTLSVQPARAFDLPGLEGDSCDTPRVIQSLKNKVDGKYRLYTGTKLALIKVTAPTMTYERRRDASHAVGRKFCHATAVMHEPGHGYQKRDLWYTLATPLDFVGTPGLAGIEFCITGLDPWHVYGKNCSTLRNSIGW